MKQYKATIRKVHPIKISRNGNRFIRVDFVLEDGRFAKTDLCPDYRNFPRWSHIISRGPGTALGSLLIKKEGKKLVEINADSFPVVVQAPIEKKDLPLSGPSQPKLL